MRTTTMTIVLCPKEKNSPHVTGSWPILIRLRVALSIALPVRVGVRVQLVGSRCQG